MPTDRIPAGMVRHPGGCLQPVLLRGRVDHIDGYTGELLHRYTTVHEPGGVLPFACKTRRASRCPPCAEVYQADTYQLIRAGLTGGKGVPETVAEHPCVFSTLTAPSFGPVHARRERCGKELPCRPRRAAGACPHGVLMCCRDRHGRDDDRLGETAVRRLLRLHRLGAIQRLRPRAVAALHYYPAPRPRPPGRAHQHGVRRSGAAVLRQGRRIPAPRGRPLPRDHPPRRPHRASHGPTRLGHPQPAHRRHRRSWWCRRSAHPRSRRWSRCRLGGHRLRPARPPRDHVPEGVHQAPSPVRRVRRLLLGRLPAVALRGPRGDRVPARGHVRDALPARRAGRGHDRQRHADPGGARQSRSPSSSWRRSETRRPSRAVIKIIA